MRSDRVDADRISVDTQGSDVTWGEHDQAARTAWSAPGVSNVKNELTVRS